MGFAVFDNVTGAIEWAQNLSTLPKGVISAFLVLLCGVLLFFLLSMVVLGAVRSRC